MSHKGELPFVLVVPLLQTTIPLSTPFLSSNFPLFVG